LRTARATALPERRGLSLAEQFLLACLLVLVASMAGVAYWMSKQIEDFVVRNAANSGALYVETFLDPYLQDLAIRQELTGEHVEAIESLLENSPLSERVVRLKVWGRGGRVLYSSNPAQINQVFPVEASLRNAWRGTVSADITDLTRAENALDRGPWRRLLETYSPVREHGTGEVLAVIEFYQPVEEFDRELAAARGRTWAGVALATLAVYLLLAGLVGQGSRTINRQQGELKERVADLNRLLAENEDLSDRVRRAANRVAELNERFLRRISSELHDGPAQDMSLALLKLDPVAERDASGEVARVQESVRRALEEVRSIAAGLRLPEVEGLDLTGTVERAVRDHKRRTSSEVAVRVEDAPDDVPFPVKITVYRVVQEALANAFRHAGGRGQRVEVRGEDERITVTVSDEGPGFDTAIPRRGLGLHGMRERVESLGGKFTVRSTPKGSQVQAVLPTSLQGEGDYEP
jgi:signal transduction histidine kinase